MEFCAANHFHCSVINWLHFAKIGMEFMKVKRGGCSIWPHHKMLLKENKICFGIMNMKAMNVFGEKDQVS